MLGCCGSKQCGVCKVAWLLIFIGALNWGLVGIGGFASINLNVVNLLLGNWPMVEWVVYILVGLAAVVKGLKLCKCDKNCGMGDNGMMMKK